MAVTGTVRMRGIRFGPASDAFEDPVDMSNFREFVGAPPRRALDALPASRLSEENALRSDRGGARVRVGKHVRDRYCLQCAYGSGRSHRRTNELRAGRGPAIVVGCRADRREYNGARLRRSRADGVRVRRRDLRDPRARVVDRPDPCLRGAGRIRSRLPVLLSSESRPVHGHSERRRQLRSVRLRRGVWRHLLGAGQLLRRFRVRNRHLSLRAAAFNSSTVLPRRFDLPGASVLCAVPSSPHAPTRRVGATVHNADLGCAA